MIILGLEGGKWVAKGRAAERRERKTSRLVLGYDAFPDCDCAPGTSGGSASACDTSGSIRSELQKRMVLRQVVRIVALLGRFVTSFIIER